MCHVTSFLVMSYHVVSYHVLLVILCDVSHVMLCHLKHFNSCHLTSPDVMYGVILVWMYFMLIREINKEKIESERKEKNGTLSTYSP